jgi:hypothetical protein
MQALVKGRIFKNDVNRRLILIVICLSLQLTIVAVLVYGEFPPFWIFLGLIFGSALLVVLTQPSAPENSKFIGIGASSEETLFEVERVGAQLSGLFWKVVAPPLVAWGCGALAWKGFVWFAERCCGDSVLGFRPSGVPSATFGLAVALIVVLVIGFAAARDRFSRTR